MLAAAPRIESLILPGEEPHGTPPLHRRPRGRRARDTRRSTGPPVRAAPRDARAGLRARAALPREVRRGGRSSGRSPVARGSRAVPVHHQGRPAGELSLRHVRRAAAKVVRIHASSGTTGRPTVVGYTQRDVETWADVMARSLRAAGACETDIIHVAFGYGLFTGGLGAHYGAERLGATVVPVSGGQTERQIQLIRDFSPTVLMATPSYALAIADEFERQGLDPRDATLRLGLFGAEPWTEGMRGEIEARFGDRRRRPLRASGGDRARRRGRVHRGEGCAARLGGPLLPGDHRPRNRPGAPGRRARRAGLHHADEGGAAGHPLPHARPDARSCRALPGRRCGAWRASRRGATTC